MADITIPKIKNFEFSQKLVCITAYSARTAELISPHADLILVGDSLGMTLHGLDNTVGVTIDMMISAGQSVVRGRNKSQSKPLIIIDMPYGTYEGSPLQAYENAKKIMQETGADAVKLEGGSIMAPTIHFLTDRNIPVVGHVGLLPQSVHAQGGYSARGQTELEAEKLINDIKLISESGCFAVVLEGVVDNIAQEMVKTSKVPVIGIGATADCHGQVLVSDDLLGITEKTAKFVKKYADCKTIMQNAFAEFRSDVVNGHFPSSEYLYAKKS